jgi:hypothetical protein
LSVVEKARCQKLFCNRSVDAGLHADNPVLIQLRPQSRRAFRRWPVRLKEIYLSRVEVPGGYLAFIPAANLLS